MFINCKGSKRVYIILSLWIPLLNAFGQEKENIYQSIQTASVEERIISFITIRNSHDNQQDFDLILYPSLDSIKLNFTEQFKDKLPDKIVFLLKIDKNKIKINSVNALYNNEIKVLNSIELDFIHFYLVNDDEKNKNILTELSIPIKLK